MFFKGIVTKSNHNRHSSFESINLVLKSSLNGIIFEILFKPNADFCVVISFLGDFFSLNIVELSLNPYFLELLPLLEGAPHNATEL
jgi:hypothetical protein